MKYQSGFVTVTLIAVVSVLGAPLRGGAQDTGAPRTPWGAPDLGGVWDFRTITPLERPVALEGKAVLSAEEAGLRRRQSKGVMLTDATAVHVGTWSARITIFGGIGAIH